MPGCFESHALSVVPRGLVPLSRTKWQTSGPVNNNISSPTSQKACRNSRVKFPSTGACLFGRHILLRSYSLFPRRWRDSSRGTTPLTNKGMRDINPSWGFRDHAQEMYGFATRRFNKCWLRDGLETWGRSVVSVKTDRLVCNISQLL